MTKEKCTDQDFVYRNLYSASEIEFELINIIFVGEILVHYPIESYISTGEKTTIVTIYLE